MSSEGNKSKSEEINKSPQNQESNTLSNNIKEEAPSKNKQELQELESSKIFESKIENTIDKNLSPPVKFNSDTIDIHSPLVENKTKKFFKSKKRKLFDKKENIEKFCCNCTKTKCVKKYCECFSNNRFCKDCNCVDCLNKYKYSNNYISSSKELSENENEEIFCTCIKSNCNKKYCECYKSNKKCSDKCKCSNCLNNNYPVFNIKNKEKDTKSKNNENISKSDINSNEIISNKVNMDLDEKKSSSREFILKDDSNSEEESYQIQRISAFISQYQTLINVEKLSKEDMKLIGK